MIKIECDICKNEILSMPHAVITFPKEVDHNTNKVLSWYDESDLCDLCISKLATSIGIEVIHVVSPEEDNNGTKTI